jgi:hypothetical protein
MLAGKRHEQNFERVAHVFSVPHHAVIQTLNRLPMILFPLTDLKRPVNLFRQQHANHLVGKGQFGK